MKSKKGLAVLMSVAVAACLGIGGTLAWLTDTSGPVTNTFTTSTVDVELTETTGENYKMVPGTTIDKDPEVTVKANTEASWVFVEITESSNFDSFMEYTVAEGWTKLEGVNGIVYYRSVEAKDADQGFYVLKDNKVSVKDTVTKGMMDSIINAPDTHPQPTLTFQAYATQYLGFEDNVIGAWNAAKSETNA